MTPFERALVGELEGSHGDRVHVGDVHGATALHHYAGLNSEFCARARATLRSLRRSSVVRSEEHTSELQSRGHIVCRLLLEQKKKNKVLLSIVDEVICLTD